MTLQTSSCQVASDPAASGAWGASNALDFLETMADAFYAVDGEWRFTYVNACAEKLLGRARGDLLGCCLWDVLPNGTRTVFEKRFRHAMTAREYVSFEAYEPALRGWLRTTVHPSATGLTVTFAEVGERKREDLRFGALFEEAPDAQIVFSGAGIFHGNRAAEQLFQIPRERLLQMRLQDLAPLLQADGTPSAERADQVLTSAFLEGKCTFGWTATTGDGRELTLAVSLAPMPSEGPGVFLATFREGGEEFRQEGGETFRMLVEHSRAVMFSLSLSGDLLYVSRAWQDVIGTPPEEATSRSFIDFVHPDDVRKCREYVHRVRSDASYLGAAEFRVRAGDGSYRWFSGRASAVRDAEGAPVYLVGVAFDVTDRIMAEAALSESLGRLRAFFNQEFQFMTLLCPEGRILECNELTQQVTGVALEAIQGMPLWEAPWWGGVAGIEASWRERLESARDIGGVVQSEDWFRMYDGTPRLAATSVTAIHGKTGLEFFIVQGSDITDHRRVESALVDQMRVTHVIADHADSALAMLDERGRFEFVNKAFCRITGYEAIEVLGESAHEVLHHKRPDGSPFPTCECPILGYFLEGRVLRDYEDTYVRKDGSLMPVSVSLVPLSKEGRRAGGVFEFRDVTDARAREKGLELLLGLGEAMRDLQEPEAIMAVAARMLGEHLGAAECWLVGLDPASDRWSITHAWTRGDASSSEAYVPFTFEKGQEPFVVREPHAVIECPILFRGRPVAKLVVRHDGPRAWTPQEIELVETVTHRCWAEIERGRAEMERREAYEATLEGWTRTLDARDHETEGHSRRVADMAVRLARRLGYHEEEMVHLRRGALLHDIGKMGVPDGVLQKPGPLDDAEREIMKRHPEIALEMLAPIRFLQPALDIPHAHHERWDGGGYPRGLKETEIPWGARIFAVADVYDALTSDRSYRAAWSASRALAYIVDASGSHFDPDVVTAFVQMLASH